MKEGQFKPVINLRPLNRFLQYHHFKMEGRFYSPASRPTGWICRIDLKDASLFSHVPGITNLDLTKNVNICRAVYISIITLIQICSKICTMKLVALFLAALLVRSATSVKVCNYNISKISLHQTFCRLLATVQYSLHSSLHA